MPETTDAILKVLTDLLGVDATAFSRSASSINVDLSKIADESSEATSRLSLLRGTLGKVGTQGGGSLSAIGDQASQIFHLFSGGRGPIEFTKAMTQANVALKGLSDQLGIAPGRLDQFHYAIKSVAGEAKSYDNFMLKVQELSQSDKGPKILAAAKNNYGIKFLKEDGSVRDDLTDQYHHFKRFQKEPRAKQLAHLSEVGGNLDILNLIDAKEYDSRVAQFQGKGPTAKQLARSVKF